MHRSQTVVLVTAILLTALLATYASADYSGDSALPTEGSVDTKVVSTVGTGAGTLRTSGDVLPNVSNADKTADMAYPSTDGGYATPTTLTHKTGLTIHSPVRPQQLYHTIYYWLTSTDGAISRERYDDNAVLFAPKNKIYLSGNPPHLPFPPVPAQGYAFSGWYTSTGGFELPFTELTAVNSNINLYARFEKISYLVVFVDWDGSLLKQEIVAAGDDAVPPVEPAREGYIFIGWYGKYTNVGLPTFVTALYVAKPPPQFQPTGPSITIPDEPPNSVPPNVPPSNPIGGTDPEEVKEPVYPDLDDLNDIKTVEDGGKIGGGGLESGGNAPTTPAAPTVGNTVAANPPAPVTINNASDSRTVPAPERDTNRRDDYSPPNPAGTAGERGQEPSYKESVTEIIFDADAANSNSIKASFLNAPLAQGIPDNSTPVSAPGSSMSVPAVWSLLDLLLMIGVMGAAIYAYMRRKRGRRDGEVMDEYGFIWRRDSDGSIVGERQNRRKYIPPISLALSICALLLFIFTQDTHLPLVWADSWTLIFTALFAGSMIAAKLSLRTEKSQFDGYGY